MSLLNVDEDMKIALEKLCNVSFPCVETCDVDMSDPCPTGWLVKSDAFGNALSCLPPDNYMGPCGEETKLMAIFVASSQPPRTEGLPNLKSKERMAYECGVRWPSANRIDYEQFCPNGWTKNQQVYCVAPPSYEGPCARKKLFGSFEKGMKRAYAEECDVEWPLLGREASDSYPKGSALRKRKHNIGPVDPFTGAIISGTEK
ncbi:hypothetical protein C922_03059 [Plasmodium inui San Antonio 1]|uniref:CPW-WPC domain-containing protein n=1 Tax=Plasmodium inui San Antonio 1 TaxID=1237626 RepID=W7A428_9APIC|nr:hypothetical protein C922_03059 [Plasmodium inui San Antonio 1]EUD66425.1 hypothetical protein C922_03059 [Plasmodium inui San Antonio 1]